MKKLSLAQYLLIFFKLKNGAYPSGTFLSKIWKSHIGLLDVMFDIDLKQAGVTAAVFVRYITFYSSTTGFRLYFALFKVLERVTYIPHCTVVFGPGLISKRCSSGRGGHVTFRAIPIGRTV